MTVIIALIKKNLLIIYKNQTMSLLELFLPIMIIIITFIIFYSSLLGTFDNKNYHHIPKTYNLSSLNINPIYDIDLITLLNKSPIAIIGPDNNEVNSIESSMISSGLTNLQRFYSKEEYTTKNQENNINQGFMISISEYNSIQIKMFSDDNELYQDLNMINDQKSQLSTIPSKQSYYLLNDIQVYLYQILKSTTHTSSDKHKNDYNVSITLQPLSFHSLNNDNGITLYHKIIYQVISLTFISIMLKFSLWIIDEKENKIFLLLTRFGVTYYQYIFSWFMTYMIITTIPFTLCAIVLRVLYFDSINIFCMWMIMMLFSLHLFIICLWISQYFNRVDSAHRIVLIIYLGTAFLGLILDQSNTYIFIKCLFLLFPHISLTKCFILLFLGSNFHNGIEISFLYLEYDHISIFTIGYATFWSIVINIFIYIFLLYDQSPQDYFFYCLKQGKKYLGIKKEVIMSNDQLFNQNQQDISSSFILKNYEEITDPDQIEQINKGKLLDIANLNKNYGDFHAVKDFSCKILEGQVFVLLGANGAGKTTLLKLLAGIEPIQYGHISLYGHSLKENPDYLLNNIGYCPQEDIIIKDLTIKEHLELIQSLKGLPNEDIEEIMHQLHLNNYKNVSSQDLTEGTKRRLSLAMGLIGKSKLILLDEPTCGMDHKLKKNIWKYIKRIKQNKIIILTTHFFEEAEYLSDTIGIMNEGELICLGSSSHLKNKYPCGYNICLVFDHITNTTLEDKAKLIAEIKSIEAEIRIKIIGKHYIKLNFPHSPVNQNQINAVFNKIEKIKKNFSLIDYTLSTASLEDVFLKINDSEFTKDLFEKDIKQSVGDISIEQDSSIIINNKTKDRDGDGDDYYGRDSYISDVSYFDDSKEEDLTIVSQSKYIYKEKTPFMVKDFTIDNFFEEEIDYYKEKSQLIRHLKRLFISLWRNKGDLYINVIFACVFLILILLFTEDFSMIETEEYNDINSFLVNENMYYYIINSHNDDKSIDKFFTYLQNHTDITIKEMKLNSSNPNMSNEDINQYLLIAFPNNNLKMYSILNNTSPNNINMVIFYSMISPCFKYPLINVVLSSLLSENHKITSDLLVGTSYLVNTTKSDPSDNFFDYEFFTLLLLVFSFILINSYQIVIPLTERQNEIKHLNYLNGGNRFIYWLSLFLFDYCKLIIFTLVIYFITIWKSMHFIQTIIVPFSFSISSIIFSYLFSFGFIDDRTASIVFFIVNFGMTIFIVLLEYIFPQFQVNLYTIPKSIFHFGLSDINPFTSFRQHFMVIWRISFYQNDDDYTNLLFHYHLNCLFISLLQSCIYGIILTGLELNYFQSILIKISKLFKKKKKDYKDLERSILNTSSLSLFENLNEVMNIEKEKIEQKKHLPFIMKNVSVVYKSILYKTKTVLNNIYLGLDKHEKFGIMGSNGCGKSSIFKAIIQEAMYSYGTITIFQKDIKNQFNYLRSNMGYCPQGNALFDYLTVKETFEYYFKKRISIDDTIKKYGLSKYQDILTKNLSCGNKRKLIFAIALINSPQLLLLDEPTTGIDPDARRLMWKNIIDLNRLKKKLKKDFNMLISTHSFEEAEVLCETIGWMKKGTFTVIGNCEALKLQYSKGYFLTLKFERPTQEKLNELALPMQFNNISLVENLTIGNIEEFINKTDDHKKKLEYFYYFWKLDEIIDIISDSVRKLHFIKRNQSYFILLMEIDKEKQNYLFSSLLFLKFFDKDISELSIDLEPLENFINNLVPFNESFIDLS